MLRRWLFQCWVKTDWQFLSGKEEGVAPPQGSHDWSAVVRVASLRARQVCKAKDMPSCGNSEKHHQQSRTTQGSLDYDCAGAPQEEAEEDDEQDSSARHQGDPWYAPLEQDASLTLVWSAEKRHREEVVARTASSSKGREPSLSQGLNHSL